MTALTSGASCRGSASSRPTRGRKCGHTVNVAAGAASADVAPHSGPIAVATATGVAAVIFRLFDVDKDDYISVEDLNKVLGLMVGTEMSPSALAAVVAATMEAADMDRDGRISYDDFEAVSAHACCCRR